VCRRNPARPRYDCTRRSQRMMRRIRVIDLLYEYGVLKHGVRT
jgi:hypothetical protein